MKKQIDIIDLVAGNISGDEKNQMFRNGFDEEQKDIYKKTKLSFAYLSSTQKMSKYQIEDSYSKVQKRIAQKNFTYRIPQLMKYAAVIVLITSISTLTYFIGRQNSIHNDSSMQFTSVVAEFGQISKVILPDSTVVWLNSGSELRYNDSYSKDNRDMELLGEAYFEVQKNKELPFVVSCNDFEVKVLGTKFDVSSYQAESKINVVLESGQVELLHKKHSTFSYIMEPGEKAAYDKISNKLEVKKIDTKNYTSWKSGELRFVNASMDEVLKTLERKFDAEIIIKNPEAYNSVFNAQFKNENLKEVLEFIEYSCPITYNLSKNKDGKQKVIIKYN